MANRALRRGDPLLLRVSVLDADGDAVDLDGWEPHALAVGDDGITDLTSRAAVQPAVAGEDTTGEVWVDVDAVTSTLLPSLTMRLEVELRDPDAPGRVLPVLTETWRLLGEVAPLDVLEPPPTPWETP